MKVIPFEKKHLLTANIEGGEEHRRLLVENLKINGGPAYTLLDERGDIVAMAGVEIIWPGVGHAWAVMTGLIKKYPVALTKETRRYLEKIIKEHRLHRVQADVIEGFEQAECWIALLGFDYEGPLNRYGPNGDNFFRYARF